MVDFFIFFKHLTQESNPLASGWCLRDFGKSPNLPHTRGKKHPSGKQESHEFVLVTEGHFDLNSINLLCKIPKPVFKNINYKNLVLCTPSKYKLKSSVFIFYVFTLNRVNQL